MIIIARTSLPYRNRGKSTRHDFFFFFFCNFQYTSLFENAGTLARTKVTTTSGMPHLRKIQDKREKRGVFWKLRVARETPKRSESDRSFLRVYHRGRNGTKRTSSPHFERVHALSSIDFVSLADTRGFTLRVFRKVATVTVKEEDRDARLSKTEERGALLREIRSSAGGSRISTITR